MIKPFRDDEAAASIGNLAIENGTTTVSISGSLEITRDGDGLTRARALKQLADDLVAELEAQDLPAKAGNSRASNVEEVDNPFS